MKTTTRIAIGGAALAAVAGVAVPALAADGTAALDAARGTCAQRFDHAQRTDMEAYRDFDKETWVAGHDDDAITILNNGQMVQGRDNIAASQAGHFSRRNAVWSWTELTRAVDGCKTATIVYDAHYAIPSAGFDLHLIINVTYTYKHGHWLSVIDQGTVRP